jgi:glycosyltransferase involved in cell wall biosynthesis
MGLLFFPRGGSAHVARNLARALPGAGWDVEIVSGSVTMPGHPGDAARFYAGLDVRPFDMTRALDARDPVAADPPLHPSYEDRGPDAPDRVFASLSDEQAEHQVTAWARALQSAGAASADVLHLHHLTPLNEAAARVAPHVPVVGHLHGTELLMLEEIEHDADRWPHGRAWAQRLKRWAAACERVIVLSETQVGRAERLLDLDPARAVVIPNGFDPDQFRPHAVDRDALWTRVVGRPLDAPVLLYVGRFTAVKRLPLLIEAYARARDGFRRRAPLVLVGGFPGEHEGEHPRDAIRRTGAEDVFLAGWHEHAELPDILAGGDVIVLPSAREQFGQVLVEGMACGLPAIAVDAHGPAEIVRHGRTGWLVEPDDVAGLANALVEAVNRPGERLRRGAAAFADVAGRFAWPALAAEVAGVYDGVLRNIVASDATAEPLNAASV